MARSARLIDGVNEAVARRPRTAVQGRVWFAIYSVAFYGRVASRPTVNRSTYQTCDNNSSNSEVLDAVQGPRAIAARSERLASMEARAPRVTDARSRKHAARSKGRKEAAAARRCVKRPLLPFPE